jgi:hypothetical protein
MARPKKVADTTEEPTADESAVEFQPGDRISIERFEELLASGWTPPRGASVDPVTRMVTL